MYRCARRQLLQIRNQVYIVGQMRIIFQKPSIISIILRASERWIRALDYGSGQGIPEKSTGPPNPASASRRLMITAIVVSSFPSPALVFWDPVGCRIVFIAATPVSRSIARFREMFILG